MAILIPPEKLLALYAEGLFPMADGKGRIRLYSPDPRGILPLDRFKIPRGARREVADPAWDFRVDSAFEHVISACADRAETWIDPVIARSYLALHRAGRAHSVEVWRDGRLAGGLYGVRIGGAFFGESMFHHLPGASKAALAWLATLLRAGGFVLLDTQWTTPHLALFGGVEIPRADYLGLLAGALRLPGTPGLAALARKFPRPSPGQP